MTINSIRCKLFSNFTKFSDFFIYKYDRQKDNYLSFGQDVSLRERFRAHASHHIKFLFCINLCTQDFYNGSTNNLSKRKKWMEYNICLIIAL